MKLSAAAILSLAGLASAEVYIKEQFDDVSSFGSTPTRIGPNFSTTIKSDSPGHFFSIRLPRTSKRLHVVICICCHDDEDCANAMRAIDILM